VCTTPTRGPNQLVYRETRRRGGGLTFTPLAAAFAASFTKSEQDSQNIPEAQDYKPTTDRRLAGTWCWWGDTG